MRLSSLAVLVYATVVQLCSGTRKIKVEVFAETLCQDTTRFLAYTLVPEYHWMKHHIDLHIIPFGKAACEIDGKDRLKCRCQHGWHECKMNAYQLCAIGQARNNTQQQPGLEFEIVNQQALDAIMCIQSYSHMSTHVETCLTNKHTSVSNLKNCVKSRNLPPLIMEAQKRTYNVHDGRPLSFVPTVKVDGELRSDALLGGLKGLVCRHLTIKPSACL